MSPPRSIKDAKKLPILPDEHEFAVIIRLDMVMQYYDAVESRYWVVIQGGDGKWYRK